jgi:hypothetical protein
MFVLTRVLRFAFTDRDSAREGCAAALGQQLG